MIARQLKKLISNTLVYGNPQPLDENLLKLIDAARSTGSENLLKLLNEYSEALCCGDNLTATCKIAALHIYCFGANPA